MKIISKILDAIKIVFFIFLILIISLVFILTDGIDLNHVKLSNPSEQKLFSAQNLKIKLENKLVLKAEKVEIKLGDSYENKSQIKQANNNFFAYKLKTLKKITSIFKLFSSIDIDEFKFNDKVFIAKFDGESLKINSSDFAVSISAKKNEDLPFFLRYADLKINGNLNISHSSTLKADVQLNDSSAKLIAQKSRQNIRLKIYDINLKNPQELKHYFNQINPIAFDWIFNKSAAEQINGDLSLWLKGDKLKHLEANLIAKNLSNRFHPKLDAAFAKEAILKISKDMLMISANNVKLKSINANNFELIINNFKHPELTLSLDSNSIFNEDLRAVTAAYGVHVPLMMQSGNVKTNLKIQLHPGAPIDCKIASKLEGQFIFASQKFNAKMQININSLQKNIFIATGSAQNEFIRLDDFKADLDENNIFSLNSKKLTISSNLLDYSSEFNLNFNTKTKEFNTNIFDISGFINNEEFHLKSNATIDNELANIAFISPKIFNLEINKDKHIFKINFNAEYNLFESLSDKFSITFTANEGIKINSEHLQFANNQIYLNNLKIDFNKIKKLAEIIKNTFHKDTPKSQQEYKIVANNCELIYKNFTLPLKYATIILNNDGFILDESDKNLHIMLDKNHFKTEIYHLKASEFNKIVGSTVFSRGDLAAQISGKNLDDFSGLINIIEADLSNTNAQAKLIKALDGIGSAIRFSSANKGTNLGITIGSIEFRKIRNALIFDQIQILGRLFDVAGSGSLDLNSGFMALDLNLFTLKNTSKLLQSLPLINKIVLGGKKSSIATKLLVRGKLDDLSYKTSVATDVLIAPFKLIENVVKLPKNLLVN